MIAATCDELQCQRNATCLSEYPVCMCDRNRDDLDWNQCISGYFRQGDLNISFNAFTFASANAKAAFAIALVFDCTVVDAFAHAFAFSSSEFAIALIFYSNAFNSNQLRNKCESNVTVSLLSIMCICLVGFIWNKHQEDQYELNVQCMKVTVLTHTRGTQCVNG